MFLETKHKVAIGVVGMSVVSVMASCISTQEIVGDKVFMISHANPDKERDAWHLLLDKVQSKPEGEAKTHFFHKNNTPKTIQHLADTCTQVRNSVYKSIIYSENRDLISDAEKYCSIKISEVIVPSFRINTKGSLWNIKNSQYEDRRIMEQRFNELKRDKNKLPRYLSSIADKIPNG